MPKHQSRNQKVARETTAEETIARCDSKGTSRNTLAIAAGCCLLLLTAGRLRRNTSVIPAKAGILSALYADLYTSDQYNGQYAGEFNVLEGFLSDSIREDESISMDGEQLGENFAHSPSVCMGSEPGGGCGDSRTVAGSPLLLTGGGPCTSPPQFPEFSGTGVPFYSHGGFDGGVTVGFDGEWDSRKFSRLLDILEEAKNSAGECAQEGMEGFPLDLDGIEVLVSAKGGCLSHGTDDLCRCGVGVC